jgi:hypothetical protein
MDRNDALMFVYLSANTFWIAVLSALATAASYLVFPGNIASILPRHAALTVIVFVLKCPLVKVKEKDRDSCRKTS